MFPPAARAMLSGVSMNDPESEYADRVKSLPASEPLSAAVFAYICQRDTNVPTPFGFAQSKALAEPAGDASQMAPVVVD